jgi:hypothetical protein
MHYKSRNRDGVRFTDLSSNEFARGSLISPRDTSRVLRYYAHEREPNWGFFSRAHRQGFKTDDGFDADPYRKTVLALVDAGSHVSLPCAVDAAASCGPLEVRRETPLHYAAAGGDIDIVRILLKAGADPDLTNSSGETPAEWSSNYFGSDAVRELLVSAQRAVSR